MAGLGEAGVFWEVSQNRKTALKNGSFQPILGGDSSSCAVHSVFFWGELV